MALEGEKLQKVCKLLRDLKSVLVAYSGGVDSTLLAYLANQELGSKAVAVTAISPSVPASDLEEAKAIAQNFKFNHLLIGSKEFEDERYLQNTAERCYWCKSALAKLLEGYAKEHGLAAVIDGSNADDLDDYRPGRKAAREHGWRPLLLEAGLSKAEIRAAAKNFGLPNWNKPSKACLSSRIPYGTRVTPELMRKIEAAELAVERLGVSQVRVRHHETVARIEVPPEDFSTLIKNRAVLLKQLKELGYQYITLDLAGYRMGSLNLTLGNK